MISFINTSKSFRGPGGQRRIILNRANLRIDARQRVGILAASGSGKTTIARLMGGTLSSDGGVILRSGRLSWPLAFSGGFHPALSAAQNTAMVAGLYNLDPADLTLRVQHFAELGRAFVSPMAELSPGQRNQVAMGISLAVDFDMYLADEFSAVGPPDFQDKVEAALDLRLSRAGLILLTRHAHTIDRLANRVMVLAQGQLIDCADTKEAKLILEIANEMGDSRHVTA